MAIGPTTSADTTRNAVLDRLPVEDARRLLEASTRVTLPQKQILYAPNETIDAVYFPLQGVISMVTVLEDGTMVEHATVGKEGIVGVPMVLGSGSAASAQCVCQVSGEALRMSALLFRKEIERSAALAGTVNAFCDALFQSVGQNVACNRLHSLQQRCAKWLLLTHDHVGQDQFHLTHEFIAQMLGTRRAGVTEAASRLQSLGLIRYRRGHITILDRNGLKDESCECHAVIAAVRAGL